MDKVISVLSTALPVFLALAMGMLCRNKNFLTRDGVNTLKKSGRQFDFALRTV